MRNERYDYYYERALMPTLKGNHISHFSLHISHFSFLISHLSFLTSHFSFLISHFSPLTSLVVSQKDTGKDGAADAMPGTTDGTGEDG